MPDRTVNEITKVTGNMPLAAAIHQSVSRALRTPRTHLVSSRSVRSVFAQSLNAAIRDIRSHPRGRLFQRLIEHGPSTASGAEGGAEAENGPLSLDECVTCAQFIYSHMVNRFKGELAELLALEPCIELMESLQAAGRLPDDVHLYWGETIWERRRGKGAVTSTPSQWTGYAKGADGLLLTRQSYDDGLSAGAVEVLGVVEVKSMRRSVNRILAQIDRHVERMHGGARIGQRDWSPERVSVAKPIRLAIVPSSWKVSRDWRSVKTDSGSRFVFPEPGPPPVKTGIDKVGEETWRITLAWSEEALEEAAFEMTYHYMSQVGECVYAERALPKAWQYMTPNEAGYNAVKEALYWILLGDLTKRQARVAAKLYNVYSFGYALGVGSKRMLWPSDFPDTD